MKIIKSACIKQELIFPTKEDYEIYIENIRGLYEVVKTKTNADGSIEIEINRAYNNSPLYTR